MTVSSTICAAEVTGLLAVPGPTRPVTVLGAREPCWACGRPTTYPVGFDPGNAPLLWARPPVVKLLAAVLLPAAVRAGLAVGAVRARRSLRDGPGIYTGCGCCDAVMPDSVLFDDVVAEVLDLDGPGGFTRLVTTTLPVLAWQRLQTAAG